MTTVAILCSGQGYQGAGMYDLVGGAEVAQPVFEAATKVLGQDPRALAASGDGPALHANLIAQVLCCAQALAAWAVLGPQVAARVVVAGYSVGEVPAWGVAGALDAAGALELVAQRAKLMDAATQEPAGLAAVGGLSGERLARICRDAGVHVAIRNGPDHVVLGGTRSRLDRVLDETRKAGAQAVTPLPVAVPAHTPLLREAAEKFAAVLHARADIRVPEARLLSGLDGAAVRDVAEGLDKLARQIGQTVEWAACMDACRSAGASRALELGPGSGLARMMALVLGERDARSLADFRSLSGAAAWLAGR